jgi:uncharacterized protein DUF4340
MSEQALKRLVGALVVAVALWGVTTLLSSDGDGARAASGEIATLLDGISETSVSAVRMTSVVGETELSGGLGAWTVNGFRSDSNTVARFWTVLENASIGQLVATNPSNHERMDITDAAAWTLEVDIGADTRTLLVGGEGPQFATAYVRLPGADEVYLMNADLRIHMRRQMTEWRNKRVVALDTAAVARVEIERGEDRYVVVRGAESWTFENGDPIVAVAVLNLLTDLKGFETSGVLVDDEIAGAEQEGRILVLDGSGQTMAELTLGAGEADRWIRAEGDDVTYRLAAFRVDRLFPALERVTPDEGEGA